MIRDFLFPHKFTGMHMMAVMCLFFGTIITVNLTLAYFAAGSWTGLIVKNTYVESQIFDDKKAVRAEQLGLGWSYHVAYQDGYFQAELKDRNGDLISPGKVEAKFERIIHENEDQLIALTETSVGLYKGQVALAKGQWNVHLNVYEQEDLVWTMPIRLMVD